MSSSGRRQLTVSTRVRPGTKLFMFDCRTRVLSGTIYEITTFPHLFNGFLNDHSTRRELLSKIYFQVYENHQPLEERVFRLAIDDNYTRPYIKFSTGLSENQVKILMALYSLQGRHISRCVIPRSSTFAGELLSDLLQFNKAYNRAGKDELVLSGPRRETINKLKHSKRCGEKLTFGLNEQFICTGANAIPLNPRKKRNYLPAPVHPELSNYDQERRRLTEDHFNQLVPEISVTGSTRNDSSNDAGEDDREACSSRSLEDGEFVASRSLEDGSARKGSADDAGSEEDQEAAHSSRSLEDGEFVAPGTILKIDSDCSNGNSDITLVKGPDKMISDATNTKFETRNFIGPLDESLTSAQLAPSTLHKKVKPTVWLRLSDQIRLSVAFGK